MACQRTLMLPKHVAQDFSFCGTCDFHPAEIFRGNSGSAFVFFRVITCNDLARNPQTEHEYNYRYPPSNISHKRFPHREPRHTLPFPSHSSRHSPFSSYGPSINPPHTILPIKFCQTNTTTNHSVYPGRLVPHRRPHSLPKGLDGFRCPKSIE